MILCTAKSRLEAVFADYPRMLRFTAVFFGAIALLKGIRFPNLWSATQAQLDYRHGFVKRALLGQLLTGPLGLNHYSHFVAFSFAALAAAILLLVLFIRESGLAGFGSGEVLALFFSSMAFTYLADLIGYIDILQLSLTLLLLFVKPPVWRFAGAFAVTGVALLLHEGFLFLFLPVILFSFFADAVAGRLHLRNAILMCSALALFAGGLAVAVGGDQPMSVAQSINLEHEIAARVDFPVRPDFFEVMQRSVLKNVEMMAHDFVHNKNYAIEQFSATIMFAPVLAFLLYFGFRMCRISDNELLKSWGVTAFALVGAGPLLMHFLGWDMARWDSFACLSVFLALALLARDVPLPSLTFSPAVRNLTLFAIALNMASGEVMLNQGIKPYPFLEAGRMFRMYLTHERWHPPFTP